MLRSSTIRNAAQITNIGTLLKEAGVACVKCLDTKKLWMARRNDGRGMYQIIECTDCDRGGMIMTSFSIPQEDGKTIYEMNDNNIQQRIQELEMLISKKQASKQDWVRKETKLRLDENPSLKRNDTVRLEKKSTIMMLVKEVKEEMKLKKDDDKKDEILKRANTLKMEEVKVEDMEEVLIDDNSKEPEWRRYTEVQFEFPFEMTKFAMSTMMVEREELRLSIDNFNLKDYFIDQFNIVPHQSVKRVDVGVYLYFTSKEVTDKAKAPWFICGCTWKKETTTRIVTARVMIPKNQKAFDVCEGVFQSYNRQLSCLVPITIEKAEEEKKKAEEEKKKAEEEKKKAEEEKKKEEEEKKKEEEKAKKEEKKEEKNKK